MNPQPVAKWPRFRILSAKGVFLGWIQRPTKEEAATAVLVSFPWEAVRVEFRETDQD